MTTRIRLFIDPLIRSRYGPEVYWVWRLLLSVIGYSWSEAYASDSECDIAYITKLDPSVKCRIRVLANVSRWERMSQLRLSAVTKADDMLYPVYNDEKFDYSTVSIDGGRLLCDRDFVFDTFWFLTGQEENSQPRDKHGLFQLAGTRFYEERVMTRVPPSTVVSWLARALSNLGFPPPVSRWPGKRKAAACLSHDVDYPEICRFLEPIRQVIRRKARGARTALATLKRTATNWHFSSWVDLENQLGVRSAFYFFGGQGSVAKYLLRVPDPFYNIQSERFRRLFSYLRNEGCEIGLHASYQAFTDESQLQAEKHSLEVASGQQVIGNRHHYWHLNPLDPDATLLMHQRVGLAYDTSLGHERYVGWRRGFVFPFFPFHRAERRQLGTLQISTAWMDAQLFDYLPWNPGHPYSTLEVLVQTTADHCGCLLVNVHDYVFDDTLYPGWAKTYTWLIESLVQRSDFWIATPSEVARHWGARYALLAHASNGLTTDL